LEASSFWGVEKIDGAGDLLGDMFSALFNSASTASSNSVVLSIIFTALFCGADFSGGTIRNAILAKKSRWQITASYAVVSVLYSWVLIAVEVLVYVVFCAIFGAFTDYSASTVVTGVFSALGVGVVTCTFASMLTLMMLLLTKKKSLAIVIPLVAVIVLAGVVQLFYALALIQGKSTTVWEWLPFSQHIIFDASAVNGALLGKILISNVLFACGFGGIGYAVFNKAQLK
jgi:hypothetical protein